MNKAPVFQHRHYKAIAALIAAQAETGMDETIMYPWRNRFADMFAKDNPRFDRARFLAAANGKPINGRDNVRS